jgi:hypothetical protein
MTCYRPLVAYKNDEGNVVFNKPYAFARAFNLPCGHCIGCRLNYSRQWAVRCMHESAMHESNSFITLTFDENNLWERPNPMSLDVTEYQRFMKRLRKRTGKKIRFFHCGEYGEKNKRPHYHALIFGYDFDDKELWSKREGVELYVSEELQQLWPYGFSTIGHVTYQSAAYCSRYIMKKQRGEASEDYYTWIDDAGEIRKRVPEYCTMSRREGIGHEWFKKYKKDVYPHDYVVVNGKQMKPPRYYDNLLSEEELEEIKKHRREAITDVIINYDDKMQRLFDKEELKEYKIQRLVREL